ncbi:MmpS family transport accessory protein [Micromonosporaceae bacterium B7E4]
MRTRSLTTIGLSIAAVSALACGMGSTDTAGPGAQGEPAAQADGKKIVLEVTGAKSADITYGVGADQSQDQGVKVPWKKEMTSKESFLIVSLVAQNKGRGTIACKITIDGKVAKENKSTGEYAVVTCTN